MQKPKHHIFVCSSSRVTGEPKGTCNRKDAANLIMYLETELSDRGFDDVMVSNTGCLKLCEKGPVMIVYPEGYWYGPVDEAAIDKILDALEDGSAAEDLLIC